jgi:hypothetical protein
MSNGGQSLRFKIKTPLKEQTGDPKGLGESRCELILVGSAIIQTRKVKLAIKNL